MLKRVQSEREVAFRVSMQGVHIALASSRDEFRFVPLTSDLSM